MARPQHHTHGQISTPRGIFSHISGICGQTTSKSWVRRSGLRTTYSVNALFQWNYGSPSKTIWFYEDD